MSAVLKTILVGLAVCVIALAIVDAYFLPSIPESIAVWLSELQAAQLQLIRAHTALDVFGAGAYLASIIFVPLVYGLMLATLVLRVVGAILGQVALTLVRFLVAVCAK